MGFCFPTSRAQAEICKNSALSLWIGIQSQQMLFKYSSVVSGSSYWEASFNEGPSNL